MTNQFGVIAEDNSDIDVAKEIINKYFNENTFIIKKYVGKGSGKLKQKCAAWVINLRKRGCNHIFLFHDLDNNDLSTLRKNLEAKINVKSNPNSLVIIPVKEMEAWLLTDTNAIKNVFNLEKKPKSISNSEIIDSPKEYLRDLVWRIGKKRYLNTVHNSKIASLISIDSFKHCQSYLDFDHYINTKIKNI